MEDTEKRAWRVRAGAPETPPYTPDELRLARFLARHGRTDELIARGLQISLYAMATWAWFYEEFFDAITPSEEELQAVRDREERRLAPRREKSRTRRQADPSFRLESAFRANIWHALKKGNTRGRIVRRVGYSIADLMAHLESRFQPGMTWQNYGKWHVDHIKPVSRFNCLDPVEFAACWALSNLQPLWARDNIAKGAKYAGA